MRQFLLVVVVLLHRCFIVFWVSSKTSVSAATVSVNWGGVDSSYFHDFLEEPCLYDGEILLSHPMSIDVKDKHYVLGTLMLKAAQMTVDKINMFPRCGVSVGGKNYSLSLRTYGDDSDQQKTARIGMGIVNETDFMLAGYSSSLTSWLTPIAQEHSRLCVTGGSSRTSVHADRDYVFGLNPPSASYLENAFKGVEAQGAKTVAFLAEESTDPCGGTERMAQQYGLVLLRGATIPEHATLEQYIDVAQDMAVLDPDLMITCIRTRYGEWNQAMRFVDWTPRAQVYTYIAGTDEFNQAIGPVDLPYIMAVSGWDSALPPIPDAATGWTPKEFDLLFQQAAFRRAYYQQVQQSAVISVLAQAIERVGAFRGQNATNQIRDVLASGYFPTVYGNVSFDENGQNAAPFLLLQYDKNSTLHVLLPEDQHHSNSTMVYPLPTWRQRDCMGLSTCEESGGTCNTDGSCDCPAPLLSVTDTVGSNATCIVPTLTSQIGAHIYALGTIIPFLSIVASGVLLYMYTKRTNDALWQINKDELHFHDPPHVIGEGTFGLVVLAEFRGTQVAVKQVLPARDSNARISVVERHVGKERKFELDWEDDLSPCKVTATRSNGSDASLLSAIEVDHKVSIGKLRSKFIKEMRTLSLLRHPSICTIMGAVISPPDTMLVMEYMTHGSLKDLLANETMLIDGEMLLTILRDISQGCRFLHGAKPPVIHGDLKAANILIDSKLRGKVSDFGLSQKTQSGITGSPYWMAPELLNRSSRNNAATDVYSFGILIFEAYSREDPYQDEGDCFLDVLQAIADPTINKRPPVPDDCPPQVASLMCDCIVAVPEERPTFEELDKRLQRIDVAAMESASSRHPILVKGRSSVSLFDIFPRKIAEALKEGRPVEAEHRDETTIFFSDIVGFTTISSQLEPRKVAAMLHNLYSKFDALSVKHDIFKVETIGDAYMCVTNLVKDQPNDHATRIAMFAVDAIEAANRTLIDEDKPSLGHVDIRVGFHSGAVVADVVGSKNPRYCLFGDTVNTASRMESNSSKNKIHCSQAAYDMLQREGCHLPIVPRGLINVKGKGMMSTYWVNEQGLHEDSPTETTMDVEEFRGESHNSRHLLIP